MSAYVSLGTTNIDHVSISPYANTIPSTTKKGPSKEVTNSGTEDSMNNDLTRVPIMSDTQCFIKKSSIVTWMTIKCFFNTKEFPKDLHDRKFYDNVKKSGSIKLLVGIMHYPVLMQSYGYYRA